MHMGILRRKSFVIRLMILICWGSTLTIIMILNVRTWISSSVPTGHILPSDPTLKQSVMSIAPNPLHTSCINNSTNEKHIAFDCQEEHCSEFLTKKEKVAIRSCAREVYRHMDPSDIRKKLNANNCRFINGRNRLPVALVSAEGSGNTWIRGLLEKATGICTGFLHCDYVMRMKGFVGESVKSGSVIVVKTHAIEPQGNGIGSPQTNPKQPYFRSAIFILRNPYDSLVAEWNRRVTNMFLIPNGIKHNESHTNIVPEEYWRIPEWDVYLHVYIDAWKDRIVNWLMQNYTRLHIVRYENLKSDTLNEVVKMLDFLNIPYISKEDIYGRICKGYTEFKRPHGTDYNFEHFTWEQKNYIRSVLQETKMLVIRADKEHLFKLDDYFSV